MPMSRSVIMKTGVCSRSARSNACAPISKHSYGSSGKSSTCLVSPCEAYAHFMTSDCGVRVLGLDDGELVLAAVLVDAQLRAGALEGLGERGGRRDRVPGADGGAAVQAAERGRGVALDEDLVADGIGALGLQAHRVLQVIARVVEPHLEGIEVGLEELLLALVLLADQLGYDFRLYPHHAGERADVEDVLEELPLP